MLTPEKLDYLRKLVPLLALSEQTKGELAELIEHHAEWLEDLDRRAAYDEAQMLAEQEARWRGQGLLREAIEYLADRPTPLDRCAGEGEV